MSFHVRFFGTTALILAALSGCKGTIDVQPEGLQQFESCDALRTYITDVATEDLIFNRFGVYYMDDGALDAGAEGDSDGASSGPTDYTTTNVQEEGVDEADFVKTDGEFIYVAQGSELTIVKSWPAVDTEIVSRFQVEGNPSSMFLRGDRVILFSWIYGGQDGEEFIENYGTRMQVIDVSDRTAPRLIRTVDMEGYFNQARMVNGEVYAVMNNWSYLPSELWEIAWGDDLDFLDDQWDADEATRAKYVEHARDIVRPEVERIVEDMALSDFLPSYRDQIEGAPTASVELLHDCTDLYRPGDMSRLSVLSLVHIDLDDDTQALDSVGLLSNGWTVYASQDNLYIAQTNWWSWWWDWDQRDAGSYIHKFKLGDGVRSKIGYEASGAVDGWILDQWSMSEHDGSIRVATTDFTWWGWNADEEGGNNIFVMDQNGGALETVGDLTGIAPGERIFASRMMGDRGYIVTFRQTDPLFTLDLSDKTAPKIVGVLEMPGFSSYLHPVDEDTLLGVGMAGEEDGTITGLSVKLFDVSDFANPTIADSWELETGPDSWSSSQALSDHHAFTFHRGVLSIPAYLYDWSGYETDRFSGLVMLGVDESGLHEVGRVDHEDLVRESECLWGPGYCDYDNYYWYAWMRRSVYVEDNVFSISNYGIKVNDLNNPEIEHARVLFYPN
jgi:hypothetical protein